MFHKYITVSEKACDYVWLFWKAQSCSQTSPRRKATSRTSQVLFLHQGNLGRERCLLQHRPQAGTGWAWLPESKGDANQPEGGHRHLPGISICPWQQIEIWNMLLGRDFCLLLFSGIEGGFLFKEHGLRSNLTFLQSCKLLWSWKARVWKVEIRDSLPTGISCYVFFKILSESLLLGLWLWELNSYYKLYKLPYTEYTSPGERSVLRSQADICRPTSNYSFIKTFYRYLLNSSVLLNWKSVEHNKDVNLKYAVDVMCHSHNSLLADSQEALLAQPFLRINWRVLNSPIATSCSWSVPAGGAEDERSAQEAVPALLPQTHHSHSRFLLLLEWAHLGQGFLFSKMFTLASVIALLVTHVLFNYSPSVSKSFGVFDCACELKSPLKF